MKQTRILMGMPIIVEIRDNFGHLSIFNKIYSYFDYVDRKFSPYKKDSEIAKINEKKLKKNKISKDMRLVLDLCETTKKQTSGYFNIFHNGKIDPSGLVKGWAIQNAANILRKEEFTDFYISAGGDIEVSGRNFLNEKWTVGIRNPFDVSQIVKVLAVSDVGVATSGIYERGLHIYNPKNKEAPVSEIVSLTVIGANVYEADRFATAAFAMGKKGIGFIEKLKGLEAYMIDKNKTAVYTSGFEKYVKKDEND